MDKNKHLEASRNITTSTNQVLTHLTHGALCLLVKCQSNNCFSPFVQYIWYFISSLVQYYLVF